MSGSAANGSPRPRERVCIIGSGNWGSTIAKIAGANVLAHPDVFEDVVNMWVYEEVFNGQRLTELINEQHENAKYLPGIKFAPSVVAEPDLLKAAKGATMLVFVVPHQFVRGVCNQLRGKVGAGCKAISLIKGLDVTSGLELISEVIRSTLDMDVSVLMGANIANEVARENFSESTIGFRSPENGALFKKLFHTRNFRVNTVPDIYGVELCGALKNICAIAAGLVDGLKLGDNTKAAIMRIGLMEMKKFAQTLYEDVKDETFFESCGVADVITTCAGGRNRKVAEARVVTGKSFEALEKEMLNGQKLQGPMTAKEVFHVLSEKNLLSEFPLFTVVYRICYEGLPPENLTKDI